MLNKLLFSLLCGVVLLAANDVEADENKPTFQVKTGDSVYFRLVKAKLEGSDVPDLCSIEVLEWTDGKAESMRRIGSIDPSSIGNAGAIKNPEKAEYLIQFSSPKTYAFVFRQSSGKEKGTILGQVGITKDDRKKLQALIDESPDSPKKWVLQLNGMQTEGKVPFASKIELAFAGVSRHYELKNITIPDTSNLRYKRDAKDWLGNHPTLRFYIYDDNNKPLLLNKKLTAAQKGWSHNFSSDKKYNIFEVREGIGASYHIDLRDANTAFFEMSLDEVPDVKAEEFRGGTILKKTQGSIAHTTGMLPSATKFQFQPVPIK